MDAVLAVRSSARMSRDGISDDYEGYRHKGREYEDLARRRATEIAQLNDLLSQLGDTDDRERLVSGDYETLHGVLGDVLLEEVRRLAVAAGVYWRHEGPISDIDRISPSSKSESSSCARSSAPATNATSASTTTATGKPGIACDDRNSPRPSALLAIP